MTSLRLATRALLIGALLLTTQAVAEDYVAGKHYEIISPVEPIMDGTRIDGKIEVAEFFWYGCSHCYAVEPTVEKWVTANKNTVAFIRLPAVLNRTWKVHARAYYTAEALGIVDQTHRPFFDAMHKSGKPLLTEDAIVDFYVGYGVEWEKVKSVFNSFSIDTKLKRNDHLAATYDINGVPAFVIDGRYWTDLRHAGSHEQTLEIVSYLVAKAKQERGK